MPPFRPALESQFQAARTMALTRSDLGVAALSCCLWLTQLISFALAREGRTCAKAALLLAANFLPLAEGQNWQVCRARNRCLTLFKALLFCLLCWEAGRHGGPGTTGLARVRSLSAALSGDASASGTCSEDRARARDVVNPGANGPLGPAPPGPGSEAAAVPGGLPVSALAFADMALTELVFEVGRQSKLFGLLHSGLTFRYSRWQHTAALQTAFFLAAAAQTAVEDVCTRPRVISMHSMHGMANLLTNLHLLPLKPTVPEQQPGDGAAPHRRPFNGTTPAEPAVPALVVPEQVDTCRLLLTWAQLAFGWALPVWAAVAGESQARACFASQHVAELEEEEKEWAVTAAVGYDWFTAAFQFPLLCLTLWHLLLAAAVGLARLSGVESPWAHG